MEQAPFIKGRYHDEKDLLIAHDLSTASRNWIILFLRGSCTCFYATIAFAVCYLLIYHVFGLRAISSTQSTKLTMAQADIAKKGIFKQGG